MTRCNLLPSTFADKPNSGSKSDNSAFSETEDADERFGPQRADEAVADEPEYDIGTGETRNFPCFPNIVQDPSVTGYDSERRNSAATAEISSSFRGDRSVTGSGENFPENDCSRRYDWRESRAAPDAGSPDDSSNPLEKSFWNGS